MCGSVDADFNFVCLENQTRPVEARGELPAREQGGNLTTDYTDGTDKNH